MSLRGVANLWSSPKTPIPSNATHLTRGFFGSSFVKSSHKRIIELKGFSHSIPAVTVPVRIDTAIVATSSTFSVLPIKHFVVTPTRYWSWDAASEQLPRVRRIPLALSRMLPDLPLAQQGENRSISETEARGDSIQREVNRRPVIGVSPDFHRTGIDIDDLP